MLEAFACIFKYVSTRVVFFYTGHKLFIIILDHLVSPFKADSDIVVDAKLGLVCVYILNLFISQNGLLEIVFVDFNQIIEVVMKLDQESWHFHYDLTHVYEHFWYAQVYGCIKNIQKVFF